MSSHELHASVLRDNGLMMLTLAASLLRELRAMILHGTGLMMLAKGVVLASFAAPSTTAQWPCPRELHAFVLLGACLIPSELRPSTTARRRQSLRAPRLHPPWHRPDDLRRPGKLRVTIHRGIDLMMLDERRLGELRAAIPVERGSILRASAPLSSMSPD